MGHGDMPNGEAFLAAFLGMEVCSENRRGAGEIGPVPSSSAFPTFLQTVSSNVTFLTMVFMDRC